MADHTDEQYLIQRCFEDAGRLRRELEASEAALEALAPAPGAGTARPAPEAPAPATGPAARRAGPGPR